MKRQGREGYGRVAVAVLLVAALVVGAGLVVPQPVYAAAYTVDRLGDAGAGSGTAGDLRYVLTQVNAGSGGDTVTFSVTGTITLASALPALAKDVTITGPPSGAGVTVSGGGAVGVFQINSGVTASLANLTIADGNPSSDGGGIANAGTLTVTNSTLTGNSASIFGGGIYNGGTLTVTNSTLTANSAAGFGGGIYNNSGTLTVTNSTLAGNSAAYGGGIRNGGTLSLKNTIVATNTASNGPDIYGTVTTTGNNLVGTTSGSTGITNGTSGDIVTPTPLLGTLGNYGGTTQTIPLLPGSPAIDAGNNATCAATGAGAVNNRDQRGITRPQGARCDIGAFESRGFLLAVAGGNSQSTPVTTAFPQPLVTLVGSVYGEPVAGGRVTFTAPATGAAATLTTSPATINAGSVASVTATANGSAGTYTVTASAAGASPALSFALANTPVVSALSPASGAITGGGRVTMTGAGFAAGASVTFGGTAATGVVVVNATTLVVTPPAHAVGAVEVAVTVGGATGRLASGYTYGVVGPLPPNAPGGGAGGSPAPQPGRRPGGGPSGIPNPLPAAR